MENNFFLLFAICIVACITSLGQQLVLSTETSALRTVDTEGTNVMMQTAQRLASMTGSDSHSTVLASSGLIVTVADWGSSSHSTVLASSALIVTVADSPSGQIAVRFNLNTNVLLRFAGLNYAAERNISTTIDSANNITSSSPLVISSTTIDATPTNVEVTPANLEFTTTNVEVTPANLKFTTTNVEVTPANLEFTTTNVEVTPANLKFTTTNVEVTPACDDVIESHCWSRPDAQCFGVYETWARQQCPARCGYCRGQLQPCEDRLTNCGQFEAITCSADLFRLWAQANCRKHCHLCQYEPSQQTAPTAEASVTKLSCEDDPTVECRSLPDEGCFGMSETWARQRCPRRCGFCILSRCEDKLLNCGMYGDDICTLGHFRDWAMVNCPQRCRWC